MAPDSRKTVRAGAGLHQLNLPEAVLVEESASGSPVALMREGKQVIQAIEGCWRIDDEWWRSEPVSRFYYAVILASGQRVVVYKDLVKKDWYKQEY